MAWTKQQLIEEAYNELAMQGYVFNVGPDEQTTALRRLDSMMAMWDGKGIRLGYPLPSSPDDSDIAASSDIPDWAAEAVYLCLAIRLCANFGKTPPLSTMATSKEAFAVVMQRMAMPPEMQFQSTMPRGAGNKPWRYDRNPFFPVPTEPLLAGQDGPIEFN